jgi:hypothetical protein
MLREQRHSYRKDGREHVMPPSGFRALVALDSPYLERDSRQFRLNAGMLVSAEIHLRTRTVMEYLLSPVSQTLLQAGLACWYGIYTDEQVPSQRLAYRMTEGRAAADGNGLWQERNADPPREFGKRRRFTRAI